ncbi:hypothetical protein Tco_1358833 [Tanacetum coccineum]
MASLVSCPKHNMVAYLEKTDVNAEYHEILDFLSRSSISYALTTVSISEASIRSDLLFDDVERIDCLPNSDIYENLTLMGNQLRDVPVPMDHFPVPALTKKVSPLFPTMLTQEVQEEGEDSEQPSGSQPTPSPEHPSVGDLPLETDTGSGGNHGGQSYSDRSLSGNEDGLTLQSLYDLCVSLCQHVTTQAAEIKGLKAQIKQLKKHARPVIRHHKAWIKSVSLKTRLARKKPMKKKLMQKESVSKQGRKTGKSEPTVHKDPAFDDLDDILNDAMDYTEDAHDDGRTVVLEEKDIVENTDKVDEGTAEPKDGNSDERVEIKDIEDTDRPRTTTERAVLTLKPLLKIDPKNKGKIVLEEEAESDAESKGVNEAEKKVCSTC